MSKPEITHDNHYVPQFYLRNWSTDGLRVFTYRLLASHPNVPLWELALPRLEREGMVHFDFDNQYYSRDFRNAMAHYKVGRFLREDEMIMDDPMYGMTQKAFGLDFRTAKIMMCDSRYSLSQQLETYLNLKMS